MSILTYPFALVGAVIKGFSSARRYELLFSMSDAELTARGLDRDKLVRGFIAGFAYG